MRYCEYCGQELQNDAKFCTNCGAPISAGSGVSNAAGDESNYTVNEFESNKTEYAVPEEEYTKTEDYSYEEAPKEEVVNEVPNTGAGAAAGGKKKQSTYGIIAFVLSILGWLSVIAVFLAAYDLFKKDPEKRHELSIAALILCAINIIWRIAS